MADDMNLAKLMDAVSYVLRGAEGDAGGQCLVPRDRIQTLQAVYESLPVVDRSDKTDAERIDGLRKRIDGHRWHIGKLGEEKRQLEARIEAVRVWLASFHGFPNREAGNRLRWNVTHRQLEELQRAIEDTDDQADEARRAGLIEKHILGTTLPELQLDRARLAVRKLRETLDDPGVNPREFILLALEALIAEGERMKQFTMQATA